MKTTIRWPGGPLLLAGSGEYTAAMAATDQSLLRALGRNEPTVALVPTASGLEPGMPERWNQRGVDHFRRLGCRPLPLDLIERHHALDPALAAQLAGADLVYFSGGQPDYLIETLSDSPALTAITHVLHHGGALAGCSAGAMMMGAATVSIRSILRHGRLSWRSALGIAGDMVIIPHFDRVHLYIPDDQLQHALAELPDHLTVVGIDEWTALCDFGNGWQVSGLQTVTVLNPAGPQVFRAGQFPFGTRPAANAGNGGHGVAHA